jgi:hypothetical protein
MSRQATVWLHVSMKVDRDNGTSSLPNNLQTNLTPLRKTVSSLLRDFTQQPPGYINIQDDNIYPLLQI